MNLRKRTNEEIAISEQNRDYTGGYEFIPWLIWMRSWFFIVFPVAIAFMVGFIVCELYYMAIAAASLAICYVLLLKREYGQLREKIVK